MTSILRTARAAAPRAALVLALCSAAALVAQGQQGSQTPPVVPRPFPQPGQPAAGQPAQTPQTAPAKGGSAPQSAVAAPGQPANAPGPALLGVTPYPASEYLGSFDAGKGQRYYLYGTNTLFGVIVDYYKSVLGNGGRELFKAPPMRQFDLPGRFQEETMAYPPSVVIKDYTWNNSEGYLFIDGTKEKRFRTIIQIVPATVR